MIVGTAGHIDHGKTSLIRRLTGKDTDRLPEEKKRGISIELGYAYVDVAECAERLGFIDVPGHEKFVHTMLSGATGIDHALLIVAADDGPMPQTYEHLDILRLLGVEFGTIALTKIDAVDPDRVQEALIEISVMVSDSMAFHWPIFPVSSTTGEGIDALSEALQSSAREHRSRTESGAFRMAIDRSFVIEGRGTVVTGTSHAGTIKEGEEVFLGASRQAIRVRSIHAQDKPSTRGQAGQRLALNLVGVGHQAVQRGDWLGARPAKPCQRFDAQIALSSLEGKDIRAGLEVHLHLGSLDTLAKVHPLESNQISAGGSGLVSIQLPQPTAICAGDRFVIRDSQARNTLAGGIVLDPSPPARGRRTPARIETLRYIEQHSPTEAMLRLIANGPQEIDRLGNDWNLTESEFQSFVQEAPVVRAGEQLIHADQWRSLQEAALVLIDQVHVREPEMPGLELQRLRRQLTLPLSQEAFGVLVDALIERTGIVRRGAFLARPDHKVDLEPKDQALWESIRPLLSNTPFQPPRDRDIANALNIAEGEIRTNLRKVARRGDVVLVALDHFFLTETVAEMGQIVETLSESNPQVRAAEFRDQIGGGRKVAIQILEFFDRVGFTRRIKDNHLVRRSNPWSDASKP